MLHLPATTVFIAALLGAEAASGGNAAFHVAVTGDDASAGTREKPFATLERARDAIRSLRGSRGLPAGGVTVWIHGGTHRLSRPLILDARDSGAPHAPVRYRALPGAAARITGGREIGGWRPVADERARARLDPAARDRIVEADLAAAGIEDLGSVVDAGKRLELFWDDEPMRLARWPNEGFARVERVVGAEPFTSHGIRGVREGKFVYEGDRPGRWVGEPEAWLHGYWFWDWSDAYAKIASIDPAEHVIALAPPWHHYGYRDGQRFYALNVLAELDAPGEWHLDRARGLLRFWPPGGAGGEAPVDARRAVVSIAAELFILREASWVSLESLAIEACRGTAVVIEGGERNRVLGCAIRNTGSSGVRIAGGREHAVIGCDIHDTGEGGISLSGGDRRTLAAAGHVAENNHIHHFGRLYRTYRPAVGIDGVGNRAAHNRIHDGPHNAIQLGGNDHVIEFNEIHDVCTETGDVGAFYMGRDWTARGTVIRGNFFHDIRGPGLHGAMAVYLDDAASGITVDGNVFVRASRAAFIGGGRDNLVENNVFIDCAPSIHVDARGAGWMRSHIVTTLPERLRAVPFREPPWSVRYPRLLDLLDDEPELPKGNVVRRNISLGGRWSDIEKAARPLVALEDNLVDEEAGFVDAASLDLRLRPDAPARKIGFQPLPLERIGLYVDEHRAARPASILPAPPPPERPPAPGSFLGRAAPEEAARGAFPAGRPIAGAYYFYWYDIETKEHFIDPDGTDALTRHPAETAGYRYRLASWHRGELEAMMRAGIDFLLPVYWGYPGDASSWSNAGLPPLVAAAREIEKGGRRPPRIGCFYDTSTLRHNGRGYHADLRTPEGKEWLATTVRDFYSLIPPDLRASIDGRPIVWLYSAAFARAQDPAALDYLRRSFREDFGATPFIVKEVSWQGDADATYAWGAALRPQVHGVAGIGPGYDHAAVPGREPLVRDREGGAFYRRSWERLLSRPLELRPSIAVIETWNEWHEGTDIAPSAEDGDLYVLLTREFTDRWRAAEVLRPSGPFADRREVAIVLGEPDRPDGIARSDEPDGKTRALEIAGKSARATAATRFGGRYIYFDVDDSFRQDPREAIVIEVTFLDEGTASFGLDYDSMDSSALLSGAFKATPSWRRTGTGAWRTDSVRIEDAALSGRANGNDFRLVDPDGTLTVHRVAVRR